MKYKKLLLTGNFAHFKIPYGSKNQKTYPIPPISTVVGILKNIYGDKIDYFDFGFTFKSNGIFTDVQTTYKEAALGKKRTCDICYVEYLTEPILVIYTNISDEFQLNDVLNLGKTNCLAHLKIITEKLEVGTGKGFNQWTPLSVGNGVICRIATSTKYNSAKGFYDIKTGLFRLNTRFTNISYRSKYGNIQIWQYRGGNVCAKTY